jgi:PIN domain nuclease of toxin-antitoxin system
MKCVVDTHILLWTLLEPKKLSATTIHAYEQADEVQASSITFWEISLKYRLGKLDLGALTPHDILIAAKESNFKIADIDSFVTATFYELPLGDHKDPFDRMLVWYAIQNLIPLISRDSRFSEYAEAGLELIC